MALPECPSSTQFPSSDGTTPSVAHLLGATKITQIAHLKLAHLKLAHLLVELEKRRGGTLNGGTQAW